MLPSLFKAIFNNLWTVYNRGVDILRYLITGGAGFIGSHLAHRLVEDDSVSVRIVDNLSTGKMSNLITIIDKIEFIQGDLLDAEVRRAALDGADIVFHQAAIPSVVKSVENPIESHLNGCHLTILLLQDAVKFNIKRFIYAASSSAYGSCLESPKNETMVSSSISPYAASKLSGEHYVEAFAKCYPLDTVSLRYFNVFGPKQDPHSQYSGVLARFCSAFKNGLPITIFGDGLQSRDFTYIDNIVQANILASKRDKRLNGLVINIGSGRAYTLNDVVRMLSEISKREVRVSYDTARIGDIKHSLADISLAKKLLNYVPKVMIFEGLQNTFSWYESIGWHNA